ncbi:hypothetical protein AOLI_G00247170 [Acnodon oligacanthus]
MTKKTKSKETKNKLNAAKSGQSHDVAVHEQRDPSSARQRAGADSDKLLRMCRTDCCSGKRASGVATRLSKILLEQRSKTTQTTFLMK